MVVAYYFTDLDKSDDSLWVLLADCGFVVWFGCFLMLVGVIAL